LQALLFSISNGELEHQASAGPLGVWGWALVMVGSNMGTIQAMVGWWLGGQYHGGPQTGAWWELSLL